MVKKKKTASAAMTKAYGTPLRIKDKTVDAVNKLIPKSIPFNRKLWMICEELANCRKTPVE